MLARTAALVSTLSLPALATAEDLPEWEEQPWSVGPRFAHLTLTDTETDEELPLGGVGGVLRWRLSRRFSLEGSMDIVAAQERYDEEEKKGTVLRVTVPMLLSAMFHLFPENDLQIYGLAGLGLTGNSIYYEELGERVTFATPAVQLGLGARWRLGRNLLLDASIRGLAMHQKGEAMEREQVDDEPKVDGPVDYGPLIGDRDLSGGMLTVGVLFGL